jgi:hypothetical protein
VVVAIPAITPCLCTCRIAPISSISGLKHFAGADVIKAYQSCDMLFGELPISEMSQINPFDTLCFLS